MGKLSIFALELYKNCRIFEFRFKICLSLVKNLEFGKKPSENRFSENRWIKACTKWMPLRIRINLVLKFISVVVWRTVGLVTFADWVWHPSYIGELCYHVKRLSCLGTTLCVRRPSLERPCLLSDGKRLIEGPSLTSQSNLPPAGKPKGILRVFGRIGGVAI